MPAKKPPERRHNRNTTDVGTVVALPVRGATPMLAAADPGWRDEVQEAWAELWSSPLAGLLKSSDLPALQRLFGYRHRLIEAREAFDSEPMVAGSMGQAVMSPWALEVHRLEAVVQKLEDRFGLTPMARLRLGVTYEEGVSLASRNAQLLEAFASQAPKG